MNQKLQQHLSSVENVHRTNSLAIDLSTIYGRDNLPNRLEMFKFIDKQLGLMGHELVGIQDHPFFPLVFVKVKTVEILERVEQKLQAGVKMHGRDLTLYGWRCDIPVTTVKINGVSDNITKEKMCRVMAKYGVITSMDRGKCDFWKDHFVDDGTWIMRIRPEQEKGLPSLIWLTERNKPTDVVSLIFDGKISCCWKCGQQGHRGDNCRSVRARPGQQGLIAPVGLGIWCDVVREGVNVAWKGMSSQARQATLIKQKVIELEKQPKKLPEKQQLPQEQPLPQLQQLQVTPKLNKKWEKVRRSSWRELPRSTSMTSMVGHRVADVMLEVGNYMNNNRYSMLAHYEMDSLGQQEESDMEVEEIFSDNKTVTTGRVGGRGKYKKPKNQDRRVARRLNSLGEVDTIEKLADECSSESSEEEGEGSDLSGGEGDGDDKELENENVVGLLGNDSSGGMDENVKTVVESGSAGEGMSGLEFAGGGVGEGGKSQAGGRGKGMLRHMGGHPLKPLEKKTGKQLESNSKVDSQPAESSPLHLDSGGQQYQVLIHQ